MMPPGPTSDPVHLSKDQILAQQSLSGRLQICLVHSGIFVTLTCPASRTIFNPLRVAGRRLGEQMDSKVDGVFKKQFKEELQ